MAFFASRCVDCKNPGKKKIDLMLKDEDGNDFSLQEYECEDLSCEINLRRLNGKKEVSRIKAQKEGIDNEENHHNRPRTGKRRPHHW